MAGPEQKNQIDNNESLRKLAEALGQNPDTKEKFGEQVKTTNVAKRAEEYKNGQEEQTFVQTRNSNSALNSPSNHNPAKTDKIITQETSHKIIPLNPNDPKNKPEIRLPRLHPQIQNAINDIQGELNNSISDAKIKMLINRSIMSHIPGDFPIQIPENSRILSMRDPKLRGKTIKYEDFISKIKQH